MNVHFPVVDVGSSRTGDADEYQNEEIETAYAVVHHGRLLDSDDQNNYAHNTPPTMHDNFGWHEKKDDASYQSLTG